MTSRILLSPPDVGELEQEYVLNAMKSGWVAPAGPDLEAFERDVAGYCQVEHAVALSSGTAALHLALVSWGVGPGDVVVTSTMTFAATANAIVYTGAEPYFVDCDRETANMDPHLLEQALQELAGQGRRVAAVIPVDMLGKCADYTRIEEVADEYEVRVLCDAAEALGSTSEGRPAGSMGHAGVLSFNGNKVMTTSGGGMLLTNDEALSKHVRYLSTQARQPVEHYQHTEIGYNYRLSNVLAALGRAQLSRFSEMMKRRRRWRLEYHEMFRNSSGISIVGGCNDASDNCWLTAIRVDPRLSVTTVSEIRLGLANAGIETRPLWKPMHRQPIYEGSHSLLTGAADLFFREGLMLPSGSAMDESQFNRVRKALREWAF